MAQCPTCNSPTLIQREKKIREARFGTFTKDAVKIFRCQNCELEFLDLEFTKIETCHEFYESEHYRKSVDLSHEVFDFYKNHDEEQKTILNLININELRGKNVADIGCGAGSLLDILKGVSKKTFAIEPAEHFKKENKSKGHQSYSYIDDLISELGENQMDVVFCMSVIEHINDLQNFTKNLNRLLKPGGTLWLSTPNNNDILKQILPEDYNNFFYRKVHTWYFNEKSLITLLKKHHFQNIEFNFIQRFNISNFLNWITHKKPCRNDQYFFNTQILDHLFKSSLSEQKISDYLFIKCTK